MALVERFVIFAVTDGVVGVRVGPDFATEVDARTYLDNNLKNGDYLVTVVNRKS